MSEMSPSANCRLCKVSFKVKLGNLVKQIKTILCRRISSSCRNGKDSFGIWLSKICSQVGFPLSARFSVIFWLCLQPMWSENSQLRTAVAVVAPVATSLTGTPTKRTKYTLETQDKESPSWRKSKSVLVCSIAAKKLLTEASPTKSPKSLAFSRETSALSTSLQRHDEMPSWLFDNLPNYGVKNLIVHLNPLWNVTEKSSGFTNKNID